MRLFDDDAVLTPLATKIMNEDIDGLAKELKNGWKINKKIDICEYIAYPPIILALYYNKLKVVNFLIENGADLNLKRNPAIPAAADCCSLDTIKLLLEHGADLNAVNNVGSNAIHRALINKRYDLILDLIALGIDVKKDGTILRSAVYDQDYKAIEILLDQGIYVNFHTPDMVFPYNPTAVCVAAENNDFITVKLLVERGADITLKDAYGERPFTAAKKNKNSEMMEYLKALEPKEWHNEELRLAALISYKLPQGLIEFLRSNELRVEVKNCTFVSYLQFNSLIDVKEVYWKGHKFLDLLNDADQYHPEGFLVWYPKKKCLASADYEHKKFKILDKWDDFVKNPSKTIDRIFE